MLFHKVGFACTAGGRRVGRGPASVSPLLAFVVLSLTAAPAAAAVAPRLEALLRQARLVVSGTVAAVTEYDDGRVAVATLRVVKVVKGSAGSEGLDRAMVVEMRDRPSAPALFRDGGSVVAFLRPAERNSYLRKHLPEGEYFQVAGDGGAGLSTMAADEAAENSALVSRVAGTMRGSEPDAVRRAAIERALVFDLIAARNSLLVEDGAAGLVGLADPTGGAGGTRSTAGLKPEERKRLEGALGRESLPAGVRLALIKAVGEARLAEMAPVLRGLRDLTPDLQAAVWAALAQLGAPVDREELLRRMASPDSGTRVAAVQAYLREAKVDGIAHAGALALHDRDTSVRIAAIEALGDTKSPEALPTLRQVFADPAPDIYQAAGRAILAVGGRAAAETLAQLTFDAPRGSQSFALLALLSMNVGRDDPLLVRIKEKHPNPELRDLVEHGLQLHH